MNRSIPPLFENIKCTDNKTFEEREIESLPLPVQRYLRFTKVIGKDKIRIVKLKQEGYFNINGKKWSRMRAVQYFNVDSIGFVWKANAGIISVVDQFINNEGFLKVKLFRLIIVGEVKGEEIDQGEALRFLSDIIWFPSAFTNDYLNWEAIDDHTSKVTIHYGDKTASAKFHLKPTGEIEKISAKRYREIKGKFILNDWEISNLEYKEFNEIMIPYKAHVTWKLDAGDLCYYKFEVTDINYNDTAV